MTAVDGESRTDGPAVMRVTVDADRCTGHGRCYSLAPEVFTADEAGSCSQGGTTVEVPSGQEARARDAVASCPEEALTVEQGCP